MPSAGRGNAARVRRSGSVERRRAECAGRGGAETWRERARLGFCRLQGKCSCAACEGPAAGRGTECGGDSFAGMRSHETQKTNDTPKDIPCGGNRNGPACSGGRPFHRRVVGGRIPARGAGNDDLLPGGRDVPLPDTLTILSWNIGYAGLGDNMDFSTTAAGACATAASERPGT